MPLRQAVRHSTLTAAFVGSNPAGAARYIVAFMDGGTNVIVGWHIYSSVNGMVRLYFVSLICDATH